MYMRNVCTASSRYKLTWSTLATNHQRNTVNKNNKCIEGLNDQTAKSTLGNKFIFTYFIRRFSLQTLVAAPWPWKLGRVKVTSINQAIVPKEPFVALLHVACSQPGVVRI
jgi:hypothetical protein